MGSKIKEAFAEKDTRMKSNSKFLNDMRKIFISKVMQI
jgi:hypothetical protein